MSMGKVICFRFYGIRPAIFSHFSTREGAFQNPENTEQELGARQGVIRYLGCHCYNESLDPSRWLTVTLRRCPVRILVYLPAILTFPWSFSVSPVT